MATYIKPNVLVYEEKVSSAAAGETDQRPWIVGPNAQIHDRDTSVLCEYAADVPDAGLTARLPDLEVGSVVDKASVKVYADNALLKYAEVQAKDAPDDEDEVAYNVPGMPNALYFKNLKLRTNGTHYRDDRFGSRDVEVGDKVILSAYAASIPGVTQCENVEFETEIIDFIPSMEAGAVHPAVRKTNKNDANIGYTVTRPKTQIAAVEGSYTDNTERVAVALDITAISEHAVTCKIGSSSSTTTVNGVEETTGEGTDAVTIYKYTFELATGASVTLIESVLEVAKYSVVFDGADLVGVFKEDSDVTTLVAAEYKGIFATEEYTLEVTRVDETRATYKVSSASGTDSYPEIAIANAVTVTDDTDPEHPVSTTSFTFQLGRYGSWINIPDAEVAGEKTYTIKFVSDAFAGETYVYGGTQPTRVHTDTYNADETLEFKGIYDPIETGYIEQDFWIKVTNRHNTANCKNIEFSIISESGLQDAYGVQATSPDGDYYTFTLIEGDSDGVGGVECRISAADFATITIGDSWCFRLKGVYTPPTVTSAGYFDGPKDDVYIITCVNGGTIAGEDSPQVTIRLVSGLEYIGPVTLDTNVVTTSYGTKFTFTANQHIALGETWLCRVDSEQNGPISGAILANSLPESLRTFNESNPVYLNVKFCVQRDVRLAGIKVSDKQITIPANIKVTQNDILTMSGVPKALDLLDGTIKVAYREWVAAKVNKFSYISSVDDLDLIPGPLTPENPLKYGVYKALANANGSTIVYTATLGETMDAWSDAINIGGNSREVYTVVPMTQDIEVQNYIVYLINSDSGEETCSWKTCILNTKAPSEVMRVGMDLSFDGNPVLAQISSEGIVTITSKYNSKANASLKSVVAGDELRVPRGDSTYDSYIIEDIVGDTLKVLNPPKKPLDYSTGIEVWHTYTRDEQVEYIAGIAQSFANRRVVLVWPDTVGSGAVTMPGTFLCAAIAGLMAGSLPNQGLTRVSISGFDDLTRSSEYFTETQLNALAGSGVWIVTEDKDGTVFTRHAVTTSTVDIQEREEMFTRILDYIAFQLHDILDGYIGRTNVTNKTLESIYDSMKAFMRRVAASNYNAMGPLATEYKIVSVEQDDLLQDRVNVVVSLTIVKSLNNIVLRIQAG